jgi:hypothetical protein
MSRLVSPRVFTLAFGLTYAAAVAFHYPLFIYYPQADRFSVTDLRDPSLGPEMFYYGWIATAAIVGLVLALVVPKRVADRLPPKLLWLVPFVMFAGGFYREREWFFY